MSDAQTPWDASNTCTHEARLWPRRTWLLRQPGAYHDSDIWAWEQAAREFANARVAEARREMAAQLAAVEAERDALLHAFTHTHTAGSPDLDACRECGLDIRNPVHKRADHAS